MNGHKLAAGDYILGVNSGHDGAVAAVRDGRLELSYESEQDSHPRHLPASAYLILNAMGAIEDVPAVIATNGWSKNCGVIYQSTSVPYHGIDDSLVKLKSSKIFGKRTLLFESTHERSHLFCSYGMSPFDQGEPCYVLIWEGDIGSFYYVDAEMHIQQHGPVLPYPGYKYSFLFDLADPSARAGTWRLDTAGKLMALAGFAKRSQPTGQESLVIERILRDVAPPVTDKGQFKDTSYLNCGVTDPAFQELVGRFSDALFEAFYSYAKTNLKRGHPLLIAGGCGLNCEWNSKWRDSGIFRDVFVPPVTNDSGSAIGTALEAQYCLSGTAKVSWSVYSGLDFVWDGHDEEIDEMALDYERVVDLLLEDKVIAWAQGRCEMGPRALGNRSLLASPFRQGTKNRLNEIKGREWYRPIAPVCMEEEGERVFGVNGSSPFMLYFHKSRVPELEAITHVDGSARVQTVTKDQNPRLHQLLTVFKRRTGFGVLCNTSLNRRGKGFITRSRDLFAFATERHIDAVVINDIMYLVPHKMPVPAASLSAVIGAHQ